jgi:hypothetical protein
MAGAQKVFTPTVEVKASHSEEKSYLASQVSVPRQRHSQRKKGDKNHRYVYILSSPTGMVIGYQRSLGAGSQSASTPDSFAKGALKAPSPRLFMKRYFL